MKNKYLLGLALVAVLALTTFVSGCGDAKASGAQDTFTAYGKVQTSWPIAQWSNAPKTVVSLKCDDGHILNLTFSDIQPGIWQGTHAKITYRTDDNQWDQWILVEFEPLDH